MGKTTLDKLKIIFIIKTMNNLNEILYQKRITKSDLARALNVSRQRVNNWTQNKNYPQKKYIKLISNFLGVSIEKLFYNEDSV
jgi:transcriptional regulator with XRE-family HTH domain